jgi:hypothetical protein
MASFSSLAASEQNATSLPRRVRITVIGASDVNKWAAVALIARFDGFPESHAVRLLFWLLDLEEHSFAV